MSGTLISMNAQHAQQLSRHTIVLALYTLPALAYGQAATVAELKQQNAILQAQNTILRESLQNQMEVLIWSLGFAATFLIAVFGLLSFFNTRRLDQDRETLRKDLQTFVSNEAREIKQSSAESAKSEIRSAINGIKSKVSLLEDDFLRLKFDNAIKEGKLSASGGLLRSAANEFLEALEIASRLEREYLIHEALDELSELKLKDGATTLSLDSETVGKLYATFEALGKQYAHVTVPLREKYKRSI